jgi:hypothetical protein
MVAVQICSGFHQILVFRQEKVQIYEFFDIGFFIFLKDKEGVRGRINNVFSRIRISVS